MYALLIIGLILRSTFVLASPGVDEPQEKVRDAAVQAISESFPETVSSIQIRVERVSNGFSPTGKVRVSFTDTGAVPRARTRVDLFEKKPDGTWAKTGWAMLYVAHFDSVATALTRLDAGQKIEPSDITYAWIETTRFNGIPLRPEAFRDASGNLFTTRTIKEGDVLRASDVRPEYAVRTGESLLMRYRRGAIQLDLTCKARENGFEQDVVRVYSPDTGTMYRARLVGPGIAEWVETL